MLAHWQIASIASYMGVAADLSPLDDSSIPLLRDIILDKFTINLADAERKLSR